MQTITRILAACAGLGLCLACLDTAAAIYVCTDADGHRTYTDLGCKDKTVYKPPPIAPLTFAPLADAERQQLDALAQRSVAAEQSRQRAARLQRRTMAKVEGARQQACRAARQALDALASQRRKGYALSAQQALDAKEASLKAAKRQHCG